MGRRGRCAAWPGVAAALLAAGGAAGAGPGGWTLARRGAAAAVLDDRGALVGEFLPAEDGAVVAEDRLEARGAGLFRWRRTFTLRPGEPARRVRLTMDFRAAHAARRTLIPGIAWNGNRDDPGNVYHGFEHEGAPWSFGWRRTLIPGATWSEGERYSVGLWGEVGDPSIGLACSLVPSPTSVTHRLIFPAEEQPRRVLIRERGLSPGSADLLRLAPGGRFVATGWLVVRAAEPGRPGYRALLDAAWARLHRPVRPARGPAELWRLGVRFARESLWDEGARMFHLALGCPDGKRWAQMGGFAIGWCGRNGELACGLLEDSLRTGDARSREIAVTCLDAWTARCAPPASGTAGLAAAAAQPFAGTWSVTYNNGATAVLTIGADGRIAPHPSWGRGTLRVADGGGLCCDWSNGQREEYRLEAGRLAVIHWFGGARYTGSGGPAGALAPFAGIASDANTLSDGAAALLRAEGLAARCGVRRPAWRALGLAICDAALAMQRPDGRFEGPGCERGAIGASFIAPLLAAHGITGRAEYLAGARRALGGYLGLLRTEGFVWGGALDTRSIDKETVLPLLAGAVRLREITGEAGFLRDAEDAATYLAAWQIAQSIPNAPGSVMEAIRYETFGGTSVATVHMCADPYGVAAVPWLVRLARLSGHAIWMERARALWANGSQGISDGSLRLAGMPPRPAGSQDETVNYADWGYDYLAQGMDRANPRGGAQGWLTAWPTAMRLSALADPEAARAIAGWSLEAGGG